MNHEQQLREQQLKAVLERDSRFDGQFVYGVTSTRIFCCPSCPSKRPKAENLRFFESPLAAREAGFRACRRCRPEAKPNFERASGLATRDWQEAQRIEHFKSEMKAGKSVVDAQNEAGFGSSRALYERAPTMLGMTPASYGKGGVGAHIRFTTAPCELGFLLVARTTKGVCNVTLSPTEAELESNLRAEFPAATIERDNEQLKSDIESVLSLLHGQMPSIVLPLDVRATAFQWRVWQELQRIPRGQTISYSELATQVGNPKAVRAVARACATNPIALVHPCHRVVGKNGEFRGYRWGIERKKALCEGEKIVSK